MCEDPFTGTVRRFLSKNSKLSAEDSRPVIVALSGGADSVALLSVLTALGYRCIAAHCNYHLRGKESDRDEAHAEKIAGILGAQFVRKDFNVEEFRKNNNGISIETACRELRYSWFLQLSVEFDAQGIAVGHNSDDNCETLLFNLFRGTGLKGLRGILPVNDNNIIRPLLQISRSEIEAYLNRTGYDYIVDSTNLKNDYSRNKIRNAVLPSIDKVFPNGRNGILKTIDIVRNQERFYQNCISELKKKYTDSDGRIRLLDLVASEKFPELLLFEWERDWGLTYTQAENIICAADKTGVSFYSDSCSWTIHHGLLVKTYRHTDLSTKIEDLFEISSILNDGSPICCDRNSAFFDKSVLIGEKLSVRYARPGDRISPFGMRGKKKVNDLMAEKNVPSILKSRIPLLVKGEEILWIPGVRASSGYKITDRTYEIIAFRWKKPLKF